MRSSCAILRSSSAVSGSMLARDMKARSNESFGDGVSMTLVESGGFAENSALDTTSELGEKSGLEKASASGEN